MSKPVIDGTPKHKARSNKTILQLSADMTEGMEEAYRKTVLCEISHQEHVNRLLPIKVKGKGLINRTAPKQIKDDASVCSSDLDNKQSAEDIFDDKPNEQQVVSLAEILLKRDEEIREKQFFIGTTCAAILENPEARIENIGVLLDLLNEVNRDGSINFLPVRKTAMISLVEVFKDIVPEYRIGIVDKEHQKCKSNFIQRLGKKKSQRSILYVFFPYYFAVKKDTLARVNFENKLLTYYKQLLKHIESITSKYTKKLLRSEKQSVETRQLLEMAVQCMCDLVLAHPYFNYSPNLVQVLVLMLNNTKETIRKMVHTCFSVLFKTDARLDLTQHVSFKKGEQFVVLHHVSFFFRLFAISTC